MQRLLKLLPGTRFATLYPQQWNRIKRGLLLNLTTTLRYYHYQTTAVPGDHLLVRLLHSFSVPYNLDIESYYNHVERLSLNTSMALNFTSPISKGAVHQGVFYNGDTSEILIAHRDPFNPMDASREWKRLAPIRIIRHPRSDLSLLMPDGPGTKKTPVSGDDTELGDIAVILVNVPMLLVQYRAFRLNEAAIAAELHDPERTMYQFLRMYVLPNMLASQLDCSVFNRAFLLSRNLRPRQSNRGHSFFLNNFDEPLDKAQQIMIENMRKTGGNFAALMAGTVLPIRGNLSAFMSFPEMSWTQQVKWALVVSMLPSMEFLLNVSSRTGKGNQQELNYIRRTFLELRTNSILKSYLPMEARLRLEKEIGRIETLTS